MSNVIVAKSSVNYKMKVVTLPLTMLLIGDALNLAMKVF
jgi:hypothetical protein